MDYCAFSGAGSHAVAKAGTGIEMSPGFNFQNGTYMDAGTPMGILPA